jgi:hypothetical protein
VGASLSDASPLTRLGSLQAACCIDCRAGKGGHHFRSCIDRCALRIDPRQYGGAVQDPLTDFATKQLHRHIDAGKGVTRDAVPASVTRLVS